MTSFATITQTHITQARNVTNNVINYIQQLPWINDRWHNKKQENVVQTPENNTCDKNKAGTNISPKVKRTAKRQLYAMSS